MLISISSWAQNNLLDGVVITENNDTLRGKLKNINYNQAFRVKLYTGTSSIIFNRKDIKSLQVDTINYVKCPFSLWYNAFFQKSVSGPVNLYFHSTNPYLSAFDTDLNENFLKSSIKLYCNDYPNLLDTIKSINKKNIVGFITKYNSWKLTHPESKSYFENHIHTKKFFNFKASFFSPGVGVELGLSKKFTLHSMLKLSIGYGKRLGDWYILPHLNNQIRFYFDSDKRKAQNKRTFRYSGDYVSLSHSILLDGTNNMLGLEYGWQRTLGKNFFYNLSIGGGYLPAQNLPVLIYNIDMGYNF